MQGKYRKIWNVCTNCKKAKLKGKRAITAVKKGAITRAVEHVLIWVVLPTLLDARTQKRP